MSTRRLAWDHHRLSIDEAVEAAAVAFKTEIRKLIVVRRYEIA
jgi:hypothetical protein